MVRSGIHRPRRSPRELLGSCFPMNITHRQTFYWLLALLLLLPAGCGGGGPARAAVHGHVTVAGKPIEQVGSRLRSHRWQQGADGGWGDQVRRRLLHPADKARAGDRHESGEHQRHAPNRPQSAVGGELQCAGGRSHLRGTGPLPHNSPLKCDVKSGGFNFDLEAK